LLLASAVPLASSAAVIAMTMSRRFARTRSLRRTPSCIAIGPSWPWFSRPTPMVLKIDPGPLLF